MVLRCCSSRRRSGAGAIRSRLATADFGLKFDLLRLKYIGVVTIPVAWIGFVLDFTARDDALIRRITRPMSVFAVVMLAMAWTNQWHGLFWGPLVLQPADGISILVGRGFLFWLNVTYTTSPCGRASAVLIVQAIQSPYLYRKARPHRDRRDGHPVGRQRRVHVPAGGTGQPRPDALHLRVHGGAGRDRVYSATECSTRFRRCAMRGSEIIGDGLVIADAKGRIAWT